MTWLVTGASRGLGRQLALQLAERGCEVLACARDASSLAEVAAHPSGRIRALPLDLGDVATLTSALHAALADVERLDGVINNAGIGSYKPFADHAQAELLAILQVNLGAVMQICHAVLPRMRAQRAGHIVNIGSDLARRPLANMAAYVASKHGLAGFSHSLLREVKDEGIKVSLINPGIIDTGFGGGHEGSRDPAASLHPAALARLILDAVLQPGSVVVDELTVHPAGQDF
jgi:3-oxoacyl-[acyl-carrier protein] reductase